MSWFSLEGKTYKKAWVNCPLGILEKLRSIPEFQTAKAKEKFKKITGLDT